MSTSSSWEDIRIVDVDKTRTGFSDSSSDLIDIYLKLSTRPPSLWTSIFEDGWRGTIYSMKRNAWIESDCIVIHCVPKEIKDHHLEYLKRCVSQTNELYRMESKKQQAKEARQQLHMDKKKKELNDALDDLDFG